jgi:hypothetical protein
MWEPAVLSIKREGYSIKCNEKHGVVITEKFQQATGVCLHSSAVFNLRNEVLRSEIVVIRTTNLVQ